MFRYLLQNGGKCQTFMFGRVSDHFSGMLETLSAWLPSRMSTTVVDYTVVIAYFLAFSGLGW